MPERITEADGFIESEKIILERKSIVKEVAVKENSSTSFFDNELQDYGQLLKKHFSRRMAEQPCRVVQNECSATTSHCTDITPFIEKCQGKGC